MILWNVEILVWFEQLLESATLIHPHRYQWRVKIKTISFPSGIILTQSCSPSCRPGSGCAACWRRTTGCRSASSTSSGGRRSPPRCRSAASRRQSASQSWSPCALGSTPSYYGCAWTVIFDHFEWPCTQLSWFRGPGGIDTLVSCSHWCGAGATIRTTSLNGCRAATELWLRPLHRASCEMCSSSSDHKHSIITHSSVSGFDSQT